MNERQLLHEIAFGSDPELRPADRLRALELLHEIGPETPVDPDFRDELARLDGAELQTELDDIVAGLISTTPTDELLRAWPETTAALIRRAEIRAKELVQERPPAPVLSIFPEAAGERPRRS